MNTWRDSLVRSFIDCDGAAARAAIEAALEDGVAPPRLFADVIHPAFDALGRLWDTGEVTLTQQYVAARVVGEILDRLAPGMVNPTAEPLKVVVGTLSDNHGLGARLVATFLRAAGVEVVEAGAGQSPQGLAARAAAERPQVLAASLLMMRSVRRIGELRRLLIQQAPGVKLVVGGAPFRAYPELAARLAVDGWAPDAMRAVEMIRAVAGGGTA